MEVGLNRLLVLDASQCSAPMRFSFSHLPINRMALGHVGFPIAGAAHKRQANGFWVCRVGSP
jgi:hypothetical protein